MMLVKEHTLYAAPSTEFISELYPPVYYLVTALFYKLFDTVNFLIPRLISVMSLAGILILMYLIPVKEGGRRNIGLMAGGFFLSLYELHDTWYDLARVDMLFFFLLLLGCYILA